MTDIEQFIDNLKTDPSNELLRSVIMGKLRGVPDYITVNELVLSTGVDVSQMEGALQVSAAIQILEDEGKIQTIYAVSKKEAPLAWFLDSDDAMNYAASKLATYVGLIRVLSDIKPGDSSCLIIT